MIMRPICRAFNDGRTCLSNVRNGIPKIAAASDRHTSSGSSRNESLRCVSIGAARSPSVIVDSSFGDRLSSLQRAPFEVRSEESMCARRTGG